jgi:electron transport complex protein RnfG
MVFSLFIVCLVASGLLSRVYTVTKIQIDKQVSENMLARLSEALPDAKRFETVIPESLWIGYDEQEQKLGIVFQVWPRGYAGPIPVLVGYGIDSIVKKIYVASASEGLKETPGLGLKVKDNAFTSQFVGKTFPELKLTKDGGKIQAITAATISSRAVTGGIQAGIEQYKKYIQAVALPQIQCDTSLSEMMQKKLSSLLPAASCFNTLIPDTLWLGYDSTNKNIGIIFLTAPQGYAGLIPVFVGYSIDQTIKNIYIASPSEGLNETPGLGTQIRDDNFRLQFNNKTLDALKLTKDSGSIQAISGATISSIAVLDGIRAGIEKYQKYVKIDSLK